MALRGHPSSHQCDVKRRVATEGHVALLLEAIAAIVITVGAVGAVIKLVNPAGADPAKPFRRKKMIWLRFGVWLLLGLEFELAADIVRTAIAPSWTEIGQLGAIASHPHFPQLLS